MNIDEQEQKIKKALSVAVKAVYFADNSDYETALYQVVAALAGDEAANLLANDKNAAITIYCPELAD